MHGKPIRQPPRDFDVDTAADSRVQLSHGLTDWVGHTGAIDQTELSCEGNEVDRLVTWNGQPDEYAEQGRDYGRGQDPFAINWIRNLFRSSRRGARWCFPECIGQDEVCQGRQQFCTFDSIDFVDVDDVDDQKGHDPSLRIIHVRHAAIRQPNVLFCIQCTYPAFGIFPARNIGLAALWNQDVRHLELFDRRFAFRTESLGGIWQESRHGKPIFLGSLQNSGAVVNLLEVRQPRARPSSQHHTHVSLRGPLVNQITRQENRIAYGPVPVIPLLCELLHHHDQDLHGLLLLFKVPRSCS